MSLIAGKILGIKISLDSKDSILEEIKKYLKNNAGHGVKNSKESIKPLVIVTPNPEQVMYARRHFHFQSVLNKADVALPDGSGVVWAAKYLGVTPASLGFQGEIARIPGVEFMDSLVALAAEEGARIGLIGGNDGLAVKAFECLSIRRPGLEGWGVDGPAVFIEDDTLVFADPSQREEAYLQSITEKIHTTHAQIVFVGLGAPKQEYLIEKLITQSYAYPVVFMSVGGSFDIISGKIRRAPLFIRSIGFEWVWRLMREPWRWRRQIALFRFIMAVQASR